MWHYSDQRFRQPSPAMAQSAYDLLLGMRGVAVTLLFLDLTNPGRPVSERSGFVESVSGSSLTLSLAGPLPNLDVRTRFGVEVMSGPGILRFQTMAVRAAESGATRLALVLPHQIESVQRRKFSRVAVAAAVAFSPAQPSGEGVVPPGGIGQTLDLSAGGLRFHTQAPLKFAQEIRVSFNTPDGAVYRGLHAKVARVHEENDRYIVAGQFLDLEEAVSEQLVQTVFRLQIRGLAKR
ncbi:MAG TPA: PilZ domain-containing protein [Symbiobacteriaceae bacterium]|nr:PilZ domain-containing protein [Symbiobacteriaceae bacterium]